MIGEIQAGFSSAKAALDILKGVQSLQTDTAKNQAVIDVQRHVIEAQQGLATSMKRINELEAEIVRLEDWSAEKERYQLKRYQPGSIAYALKPEMARGEPMHLLCPNCYQRAQKSFLQATGETIRRYRVHRCPSCKAEIALGPEMNPETAPTEGAEPIPPEPAPYDRFAELRDED